MKPLRGLFLAWFAVATLAYGRGNSFGLIRYNGGTLKTSVDPKDWGNHLTVTPEEIKLQLRDDQTLNINPKRVTSLSYGQEAHRQMGTVLALGIGLIHKTRAHFIGIEFTTEDGKRSGVLLQAHKDNYRAVLTALRGATGVPIAVADDDSKYVPSGPGTVAREPSERAAAKTEADKVSPSSGPALAAASATKQHLAAPAAKPADPQTAPASPAGEAATVAVKSTPDGADITLDGKYVGSTPSTMRLAPGDHAITIEKSGFSTWQRTITVSPGGNITVEAPLEKVV